MVFDDAMSSIKFFDHVVLRRWREELYKKVNHQKCEFAMKMMVEDRLVLDVDFLTNAIFS